MKLSDLVVEVRDKSLKRVGVIAHDWLNITCAVQQNNVGNWQVNLANEHPMASALKEPGSGILVTLAGDVILSGPMSDWSYTASSQDPVGSVTFTGVTDDVILADRLAYPVPTSASLAAQGDGTDARTGACETLMHEYVKANIGPDAPSERRIAALVMGDDGGHGPTITEGPRFKTLGNLLAEIALLGNLNFRVIQVENTLVFETWEQVDRTAEIRLDVRNSTLEKQTLQVGAPDLTRAIVVGTLPVPDQTSETGQGYTYAEVTTSDSLQAETDWNRRIEQYVSQGNTTDADKLAQAGDKALADKGMTQISANVTPMDGETMRYGIDWKTGDLVAVVVADQELAAVASGLAIRADQNGLVASVNIGDPTNFDPQAILRSRVKDVNQRLAAIERG